MSEPLFTPGEAEALVLFLDRVPITGHQERHAMSVLVNKLAPLMPPQPGMPVEPTNPADTIGTNGDGSSAEIGN